MPAIGRGRIYRGAPEKMAMILYEAKFTLENTNNDMRVRVKLFVIKIL